MNVCALIPHYESAEWLSEAIESLLDQSRPPDAVVVIDDASAVPPLDVVSRYPSVTLLVADDNVGPYRLVQTVIDGTDYDAYLFQDADDLSHPARLARLLDHAVATGADMVGSWEVRIDAPAAEAVSVDYPTDVNRALDENPIAFALLHPTSLVSRSLIVRAGGYPGGLRFGGDVEFLWRAAHVGRIVNVPEHLYHRRVGHESLSGAAGTGLRSAARRQLHAELWRAARANASAAQRGEALDLRPFASAAPVKLRHLAGPRLDDPVSEETAKQPISLPSSTRRGGGPVVVLGAPRSGTDLVMWGLDQHLAFRAVSDGRWLGDVALALSGGDEPDRAASDPSLIRARAAVARALGQDDVRLVFSGPHLTAVALEILALDPRIRFVYVARDPDATVASLQLSPASSGDFYAGDAAMSACRSLESACGILEATLPARSILRLEFDALMSRPVEAMKKCLEFLGQPWLPACARPVTMAHPVSDPPPREESEPANASNVAADLRAWRRRSGPGVVPLADRLRDLIGRTVPPDAVVSVVSKGDPSLLLLGAAEARHFPEGPDGVYAGEYPATSDIAVVLLETARRRGTTHFVVPAPALWWLTFYGGLTAHLEEHYEVTAFEEGTGAVFRLLPAASPEGAALTRLALPHASEVKAS